MAGTLTLVGRDREMQEIAAALADPDLGGVVLSGPGGVGKTRLGEECLRLGEAAGYATARATATASARAIPLGALAPLLTDVRDDTNNLLLAARAALSQRAGGRRWILFVDDAHLLDVASAALLQGLAAERTAFVVATVRTGEPPPDAVTALWKDGFARRIEVAPLSDRELARIAELILGAPLDDTAQRTLCRLARGNALAMRELVTGAREGGRFSVTGGRFRLEHDVIISDRLSEVLVDRLDALDAAELAALEVVAVGEPVDVEIVPALFHPAVAESLERQRLLQVRTEDGAMQVWLGHPLHGEIVRDRLPVFRRRAILADLVAALDGRATDRSTLLRMARWRLELGTTDDAELLGAAARWSWLARDLDATVRFASPLWEKYHEPSVGTMLGASLTWLGRHDEALSVLDLLVNAVDDETRALATIFRAQLLTQRGELDHALETYALQDLSSPWREELAAHHARILVVAGRIREALDIAEPIARLDHPRAAIEAGFVVALALVYAGRPHDAITAAQRSRSVHASLWERELLPSDPRSHEVNELVALALAGRYGEAEPRLREIYEHDKGVGSSLTLALQATALGTIAANRGRLREAGALFRQGAEYGRSSGPRIHERIDVSGVISSAAQRGDVTTARSTAAEESVFDDERYGLGFGPRSIALGWLHVMEGDTASARAVLVGACGRAMDDGAFATAVDAAHTLARAGILDRAPVDLVVLRRHVQGKLLGAKLDHAEGFLTRDPQLLTRAAQAFDAIGASLLAAEAWYESSRAFRRSGDPRAATQAARRAAELTASCPDAATPALRTGDEVVPLTNRERELALLAADGLSTKEIAARLFLSDRTVQNHLNRAYEKLGVSGRRELRTALRPGDRTRS